MALIRTGAISDIVNKLKTGDFVLSSGIAGTSTHIWFAKNSGAITTGTTGLATASFGTYDGSGATFTFNTAGKYLIIDLSGTQENVFDVVNKNVDDTITVVSGATNYFYIILKID